MTLSSDATDLLRAAALREEASGGERVRVGFVMPKVIYDRIRGLDAKVASLDADIRANLPADRPFVGSWNAWRASWTAFRDRNLAVASTYNPFQLGTAVLDTDRTNAQVDQYQSDLARWYADYAKQPSATDPTRPVAPPSAPPQTPPIPPNDSPGNKSSGGSWWEQHNPFGKGGVGITDIVPWWVWALGLVGVGLAGYSVYRTYKKIEPRATADEAMLRSLALQHVGARDAPSVVIHNAAPPASP